MAKKEDMPELVGVPAPTLDEVIVLLNDVVRNIDGDVKGVAIKARARLLELRKADG